jgi:hypothetical protein
MTPQEKRWADEIRKPEPTRFESEAASGFWLGLVVCALLANMIFLITLWLTRH